jgi:hypothetical protein
MVANTARVGRPADERERGDRPLAGPGIWPILVLLFESCSTEFRHEIM